MLADHPPASARQELLDHAGDPLWPVMVQIVTGVVDDDLAQVAEAGKAAAVVVFMPHEALQQIRFSSHHPQHGRGYTAPAGLDLFQAIEDRVDQTVRRIGGRSRARIGGRIKSRRHGDDESRIEGLVLVTIALGIGDHPGTRYRVVEGVVGVAMDP